MIFTGLRKTREKDCFSRKSVWHEVKLSVFSAGLGFNRIYFLRAKVTLPYGKLARLHFFFYLSTINSQWTLNRVSCSKKEKMADGLCQWNIGIQVDRASSPFVFLNAPFYTKGGAEQPPFEFLTFIWCVDSESHADMKDSSYRIEVYGAQFPWSALIRLLGEGQRMNERVRGGPKRLCSSADLISLPFVSLCAW